MICDFGSCCLFSNFAREIIAIDVNIKYVTVRYKLDSYVLDPESSTRGRDSFGNMAGKALLNQHGVNKLGNRLARSRDSTKCEENCLCKNVLLFFRGT